MAVSFYRKYRPQKFEELDLERVRNFFGGVLKSGRFSQAYLFSGPKGTGKTSTARILAMTLNCEKNQKSKIKNQNDKSKVKEELIGGLREPCGECESCRAIREGRSTAVVEIDAASNRGIDDIRVLRQRVGLVTTGGDYSVYIIDEVHMLTKEAFNALLKTLEEPPEHVVFCLCTTEEERLPGTVVSRCVRVEYRKAVKEEILRSLERVVEGEKLEVQPGALEMIADTADGSFRDAVKVLEQLVGREVITAEVVAEVVGRGSGQRVEELFELILAGQAKEALVVVAELEAANIDMGLLMEQLVEKARERLIESVTVSKCHGDTNGLVRLIEVLAKAFSRFRDVPVAALPVEMGIVEFCLATGDKGGQGLSGGSDDADKNQKSKIKNQSDNLKLKNRSETIGMGGEGLSESLGKKKARKGGEEVIESVEIGRSRLESERSDKDRVELVLEEVKSKWSKVLERVAKENHGLVTVLKAAKLVECEGCEVKLMVGYKFHKERLENDKYLLLMEGIVSELLGGAVRLKFELDEKMRAKGAEVEHDNVSGVVEVGDEELVKVAEEIFGLER